METIKRDIESELAGKPEEEQLAIVEALAEELKEGDADDIREAILRIKTVIKEAMNPELKDARELAGSGDIMALIEGIKIHPLDYEVEMIYANEIMKRGDVTQLIDVMMAVSTDPQAVGTLVDTEIGEMLAEEIAKRGDVVKIIEIIRGTFYANRIGKILAKGILSHGDVDKMIEAIGKVHPNVGSTIVLAEGIVSHGDVDKMIEAITDRRPYANAGKILAKGILSHGNVDRITEVIGRINDKSDAYATLKIGISVINIRKRIQDIEKE